MKHSLKGTTGRASRRCAKTYTFDQETVQILNALVGAPKGHGKFLSKLVHAEVERMVERARLREVLHEALTKEQG